MTEQLKILCHLATEAHERVQLNHADIEPIVGVHHKMRDAGLPADLMTIDCCKNRERIILILNDDQPDLINYQFLYKEQDPDADFQQLAFGDSSSGTLYERMNHYFAPPASVKNI